MDERGYKAIGIAANAGDKYVGQAREEREKTTKIFVKIKEPLYKLLPYVSEETEKGSIRKTIGRIDSLKAKELNPTEYEATISYISSEVGTYTKLYKGREIK